MCQSVFYNFAASANKINKQLIFLCALKVLLWINPILWIKSISVFLLPRWNFFFKVCGSVLESSSNLVFALDTLPISLSGYVSHLQFVFFLSFAAWFLLSAELGFQSLEAVAYLVWFGFTTYYGLLRHG